MKALRILNVQFEVATEDYDRIPKQGPLLVVANHPYGGIDGVVMGALLKGMRTDAKLLGNYLLARIAGIQGSLIQVDPFDTDASKQSNLSGMREALAHLRSGACLGVFPSGEVSSFKLSSRSVVDPPWSAHIASLAGRSGATILPIYFEGRNSLLFQGLGLLDPRLRTLMLIRELLRMRGREVKLRIGPLIQPDCIKRFEGKAAAAEYLRLKTYALKATPLKKNKLRFPFRTTSKSHAVEPLAPPQLKRRLREEIARLPESQHLVEQGDFFVYYAFSRQIPALLHEIGRLREEPSAPSRKAPVSARPRRIRRILHAPLSLEPSRGRNRGRLPDRASR